MVLLALAIACTDPPAAPLPTEAYRAALVRIAEDASAGAAACSALPGGPLRMDCLGVAAEALSRSDPSGASGVCKTMDAGLWRDECHFQVAERSREPSHCAQAGRFAEDCRMHLWSKHLAGSLPVGATPASAEHTLVSAARDAGFSADDARPWVAAFRLLGARMTPLDRGECLLLSDPGRQEICRQALQDHYNDLLNHARDTGTFPCRGGVLTGRLRYHDDPGLDALVQERRERDLCP